MTHQPEPSAPSRSQPHAHSSSPTAADRPSIGIIGAGRVGATLALTAHDAGYKIDAVYSRSPERARALATETGAACATDVAGVARSADLILVAVPDDAIAEIDRESAGVWRRGSSVIHHSGLLSSKTLGCAAAAGALTGVLHPLQAITAPGSTTLRGSYFGVSGHPALTPILQTLARDLGGIPLLIPDEGKTLYHAAAVFASNYLVACFAQAVDIFVGLGLQPQEASAALLPLARGAVANLAAPGLPQALTGPISRGDVGTIRAHLEGLSGERPELLELYRLLGRAAIPIAASQGRLSPDALQALTEILDPTSA